MIFKDSRMCFKCYGVLIEVLNFWDGRNCLYFLVKCFVEYLDLFNNVFKRKDKGREWENSKGKEWGRVGERKEGFD